MPIAHRTRTAVAAEPIVTRAPRMSVAASAGRSVLADALRLIGAVIGYGRNEEVYGEDEPAEFVYLVVSGAIRTYKLLSDGRRQIAAFRLPGDIFGLEAGDTHSFTAEAIAGNSAAAWSTPSPASSSA